jgi:endonuclease-3
MKRSEKAARIRRVLDEIHPRPPVPLDHRDPFTLLVAVLLSAQTTDAMVNRVTPALFARAPTPEAMARLTPARIHEIIKTCGLAPAKAKHLAELARLLVLRHGGRVPRTFEELEALPGVGHKTASVVMAQAFGIPAFPVDTHVHRLATRWGLTSGRNVAQTERDLKKAFPEDAWIPVHLQMVSFGRSHCPARGHDMRQCLICSWAASAKAIAENEKAGRSSAGARKAPPARRPTRPRAPR